MGRRKKFRRPQEKLAVFERLPECRAPRAIERHARQTFSFRARKELDDKIDMPVPLPIVALFAGCNDVLAGQKFCSSIPASVLVAEFHNEAEHELGLVHVGAVHSSWWREPAAEFVEDLDSPTFVVLAPLKIDFGFEDLAALVPRTLGWQTFYK